MTPPPHGTLRRYRWKKAPCREACCRAAAAEYERLRRVQRGAQMPTRQIYYTVRCVCGDEIEACDGKHGDWMHTSTRREHCSDGVGLARPPVVEMEAAS